MSSSLYADLPRGMVVYHQGDDAGDKEQTADGDCDPGDGIVRVLDEQNTDG